MEPAFQRGDLLFLWNRNLLAETDVGEIVVYNVRARCSPAAPWVQYRTTCSWGHALT